MSLMLPRHVMIRRLAQNLKRPSVIHGHRSPIVTLTRRYGATTIDEQKTVPYRQHLKQQAKLKKSHKTNRSLEDQNAWELTVGIEIHAALDTERKLFSAAATSINESPNSQVELFDLSYPGSQPIFQLPTLLPALRAAIALNCEIQTRSMFDRKHYFYPDQPSGYQITQFYEPFAKNGSITLYPHDGIAPEDGDSITIGIKQIQLEQDTAKSLIQSASETLLDFNRVSHPLIEIISLPQIHHAATAAAYVRKIQRILKSVGAVTAGMEVGGLRADVNVSIRKTWQDSTMTGHSYAGITGLGQRTEVKNLGSIKAVEDAVSSEMNRQIQILNDGGVIKGETRGWSIGGVETHRLREKEGEVDYRYMPDPDIGPLILSKDLILHLTSTMPKLQDQLLIELTSSRFGLTSKDALTLINLENGDRLEYYFDTVSELEKLLKDEKRLEGVGRLVGNWILHEVGALLTKNDQTWTNDLIPPEYMAQLLELLHSGKITTSSAKILLSRAFSGDLSHPVKVAKDEGLIISELSTTEYERVLDKLINEHSDMVDSIKVKGQVGKIMWFVGQAMKIFKEEGNAGGIRPENIKKMLLEKLNIKEK